MGAVLEQESCFSLLAFLVLDLPWFYRTSGTTKQLQFKKNKNMNNNNRKTLTKSNFEQRAFNPHNRVKYHSLANNKLSAIYIKYFIVKNVHAWCKFL
jgi:hypothetical protein